MKPSPANKRWTDEMIADVQDRHRAGESYRSIGATYGVCAPRARVVGREIPLVIKRENGVVSIGPRRGTMEATIKTW